MKLYLHSLLIATFIAFGFASQGVFYHVSIRHSFQNTHFCSGAILTEKFILTTAKCVHKYSANDLNAIYGYRYKRTGKIAYLSTRIDEIIIHPEFNADNLENDIAMLLTNSKMKMFPGPISVTTMNTIQIQSKPLALITSGWRLPSVS